MAEFRSKPPIEDEVRYNEALITNTNQHHHLIRPENRPGACSEKQPNALSKPTTSKTKEIPSPTT